MRQLSVVRVSDTISEVDWRIFAVMAYIANINERIDKVVNGRYYDVTLKSGKVVTRHYASKGSVATWLPYLDEAKRRLDVVRRMAPSELVDVDGLTIDGVSAIVAGLSKPSKMP